MDSVAVQDNQSDSLAVPGDRIGRLSSHRAGPGTYAMGSHIYASSLGRVQTVQSDDPAALPILQVLNITKIGGHSSGGTDVVLEVGHVVLTRVLRITSKQAHVEVIAMGRITLRQTCQGIIKKEDVREHEIDRVEIHKCFRPGDLVRARVVSLGDSRQYYLSTAESELGVTYAKSQTHVGEGGGEGGGSVMVPVSWEKMVDPITKVTEDRKVAKPVSIEKKEEGEEEMTTG
ncbi:exoribonuclease csl4 [Nannochloropsis oceanica]